MNLSRCFTAMAVLCSCTIAEGLTYFSQTSGFSNYTVNWNLLRTGGGASPANFAAGDTFVIQSGHLLTTDREWTVSGNGGTIYLEPGAVLKARHDIRISGTFQIHDATVDMDTNRLYAVANARPQLIMSAGWLTFSRLATILPEFQKDSIHITGGTIELNGNGSQQLRGQVRYHNLLFSSDSGIKTMSSAVSDIEGTVTISGGNTVDASNRTFGKSSTRLTMSAGRLVLGTAVTLPQMEGAYLLTGGTIEFSGSSAYHAVRAARTYYNIEITGKNVNCGNGNFTLANGGTFTVASGAVFTANNQEIVAGGLSAEVIVNGRFITNDVDGFSGNTHTSVNSGINIVFGSDGIVEYGRRGDQVITNAIPYRHLVISGSGNKLAAGPFEVGGSFTRTGEAVLQSVAPVYGVGAALIYRDSANGKKYIAGPEWPGTSGPQHLRIELYGTGERWVSMSANRMVPGDLSLAHGMLAVGDHTLHLKGSFSGTGENCLRFNGSSNIITEEITDTLFFDQHADSTHTLRHFTLMSGNTVLGNALCLQGILRLNTGNLTTGGNLTLIAKDTFAYAQISGEGTGQLTGDVTIEKYMLHTVAGWRHLSLPVNASIGELEGIQKIYGGGPPEQVNVYRWHAAPATGSVSTAEGYQPAAPTDGAAHAYAVYSDNTHPGLHELESTLRITGPSNTGNKNFQLWHTGDPADSLNPAGKGWHLIPNPYPSNIHIIRLLSGSGFSPAYKAIHFWDVSLGQFRAINISGMQNYYTDSSSLFGTAAYLSPFQGFWVKTDTAGTLQLTNNDRTTRMDSVGIFMKKDPDLLRLQVKDKEGKTDQVAICFDPTATDGMDNTLDILKLRSFDPRVPTLYCRAGAYELSLHAIPARPEQKIQLYFQAPESGKTYVISALTANYKGVLPLMIEDLKSKTRKDLLKEDYIFTYDKAYPEDRFVLHIGGQLTSMVWGQDQVADGQVLIENGSLKFAPDLLSFPTYVEITDVTGKRIHSGILTAENSTVVLPPASAAYLLVRLSSREKVHVFGLIR